MGFALSFNADSAGVAGLPEDLKKRTEIIAADAGITAGFFFSDFNMGDDIHRCLEIGGSVPHAAHVIEIGKHSDARVACGANQGSGTLDVV